jgi:hypothetical protein
MAPWGPKGGNVFLRPLMELLVEPGAIRTAKRRSQRVYCTLGLGLGLGLGSGRVLRLGLGLRLGNRGVDSAAHTNSHAGDFVKWIKWMRRFGLAVDGMCVLFVCFVQSIGTTDEWATWKQTGPKKWQNQRATTLTLCRRNDQMGPKGGNVFLRPLVELLPGA